MSVHERYETRDRTYSNWHRYACSRNAFMIDVDGLESCDLRSCRQPLLLVETARDVGQAIKPATALVGLAKAARVPAVVLLWTPSPTWVPDPPHCVCQRDKRATPGCDHGIGGFRAQHIWPNSTALKRVTAPDIARWIDGLHEAHRVALHTTITGQLEVEIHAADPPKPEVNDWPEVRYPPDHPKFRPVA